MLKAAVTAIATMAAAGSAACGGHGDATPPTRSGTEEGSSLRAAAALRRLPRREATVARVMVALERGLHQGNVSLLCSAVYDPRDVGSEHKCETMLAGLSAGDPQLTIAPREVKVHGRTAQVRADVTRSPGPVRELQTFNLRRTSDGSWRVNLVL